MDNSNRSAGRRQSKSNRIKDYGALNEADAKTIEERLKLIGPLNKEGPISDAEVAARAAEVGIARSTLWAYISQLQRHGIAGLARKRRIDSGSFRKISERTQAIVCGLYFENPDWSHRKVFEKAVELAEGIGETPPSLGQVRKIVKLLPEPVKLLAHGRENEFRNKYRLTFPMSYEGVVYQIDHCRLDVLVKDRRNPGIRAKSAEVRPWLTLAIDSRSHYVVAWYLGYDQPNRHVVKALIRKSITSYPGGVPDEIVTDNGMDFIASEVRMLAADLGIRLTSLAPHQPQQKAIVERFFRTLNTGLWSTLRGYVNSSVQLRNPKVAAKLTIKEIEQALKDFLDQYHKEVHTSIGVSPLEFWNQHCVALPVDDLRTLDLLMHTRTTRRVSKQGIRLENREYYGSELGSHIGETVTVLADTMWGAPDEIEVYRGDHHLCTAYANDSAQAIAQTRDEKAEAIRNQRRVLKSEIDAKSTTLKEARTDLERKESEPKSRRAQADDGATSEMPGLEGQDRDSRDSLPVPGATASPRPAIRKSRPSIYRRLAQAADIDEQEQ